VKKPAGLPFIYPWDGRLLQIPSFGVIGIDDVADNNEESQTCGIRRNSFARSGLKVSNSNAGRG
jgi:hypothetical protein